MAHFFDGASGFIFDCDGTLLDTMPIWNEAEARMIERLETPLTDEQMDEIRSAPIDTAATIMHERYGLGESPHDVLAFLDDMLLGFYRDTAQAKPGVVALLELLHAQGIPCSVVTSSPMRYVRAGLEHAGILEYFGRIVTTDDAGLSKQDERIYQLALDAIGADRATAWGIDDALYAVKVMSNFGIKTVGVYDCDKTSTFEGLQEVADIAVRSLEELL